MAVTQLSINVDTDDMAPYAARYGWTEKITDPKLGEIDNPISWKEAFFTIVANNIAAEATERRAYEAGRVAAATVLEAAKLRVVEPATEVGAKSARVRGFGPSSPSSPPSAPSAPPTASFPSSPPSAPPSPMAMSIAPPIVADRPPMVVPVAPRSDFIDYGTPSRALEIAPRPIVADRSPTFGDRIRSVFGFAPRPTT